ncbi:unnamed protein product [Bursaphelenchus xylophilus]|uniref:(pine wood nematode) hypothetical protein n=1 Tax=Bursaphelenchus xylophilus TaxID=6326 RepID=A0A1I7SLU0_BURXY|nr:unnamed protein product [Bursaphelenchus xylophilus]CAG9129836.1 unnamed protein product [Bursaphelenchus xylophilus]
MRALIFIFMATSVTAIGGKTPKDSDPIIIVGGGLAGLSATIEALEHGADKVYLVDKEKDLGGNSAKATSGINGCNTETQRTLGIEDNCDKFYTDTVNAGDRENDANLVDVLVRNSEDAVEFLIGKGVDLSAINLCGGHSVPRTHWLPSPKEGKPLPVGVAIIRALKKYVHGYKEQHPEKLEILTETHVLGLVTWNEYITGIRYKTAANENITELNGKAVILTTGGFSADRTDTSLLSQYGPKLSPLPTTNGAFATGDGVKMASAMGAALVGMDRIQVHPTAFVDPKAPDAQTKFLAAEALRGKGALLVNEKGARFADELGRRDYLTRKINENCAKDEGAKLPVAFMVLNDEAADGFGRPAFNFYAKIKGFFKEFKNADETKEIFDVETFKKTISEHNENFEKSSSNKNFKDSFGKHVFPVKFDLDKPFYVAKVTPAIHYTMGGLKIDRNAFVFSEFMEKPFKGLLAAGEASGGVHGGNRLAGNSLLECVVFGRIAGQSAARITYSGHQEL